MCNSLYVFESSAVVAGDDGNVSQLLNLAVLHKGMSTADLKDESKTSRNFVQVQSTQKECPSGKDISQNLAKRTKTCELLSQCYHRLHRSYQCVLWAQQQWSAVSAS